MIKKLLKLFVCEIYTELLESVEIENFETGDIKNSDEKVTREISSESAVDDVYQPFKNALVAGFSDSAKGVEDLFNSLTCSISEIRTKKFKLKIEVIFDLG